MKIIAISEARASLKRIIREAEEQPIVVLSRSRPVAVVVSPEHYAAMVQHSEDLEDSDAILYAQLHPTERVPHEKVLADLKAAE